MGGTVDGGAFDIEVQFRDLWIAKGFRDADKSSNLSCPQQLVGILAVVALEVLDPAALLDRACVMLGLVHRLSGWSIRSVRSIRYCGSIVR